MSKKYYKYAFPEKPTELPKCIAIVHLGKHESGFYMYDVILEEEPEGWKQYRVTPKDNYHFIWGQEDLYYNSNGLEKPSPAEADKLVWEP